MKHLPTYHQFINEFGPITEYDDDAYQKRIEVEERIAKTMMPRMKAEFDRYLKENDIELEPDVSVESEFIIFLEQELSIKINTDHEAVEFWKLEPAVEKAIGDLPVLLYHFTSSKLLPSIRKHGLVAGKKKTNPYANSYSGVYLTTNTSGAEIDGYTYHAVQKHGGRAVMLAVKCRLDELQPDPDDAGLQSGDTQFVVDAVTPENIVEGLD